MRPVSTFSLRMARLYGPEATSRDPFTILASHSLYTTNCWLRADSRTPLSVRQASEWGVGGLQKDYSILTRILPSNHSKRKLILDCCVLLHNFRVSYTDIPNQIRTTFSAGHLRPLFARASIPLQHSMFGIETGASTRDTALNRILHTAQSVRHEGGVPAPDDEL